MSNNPQVYACDCGKRFENRNELDKHRESCATAQTERGSNRGSPSGGGQQVRGAGGSRESNE